MKSENINVTDAKTVRAIERNAFGDPVPIAKTKEGYLVPRWSLEQHKVRLFLEDLRSDNSQ